MASTPAPETKAPSVPTVQICLSGLLEGRKNLLEALRAQAGERLEHAVVVGNLGVADHWGFLCWSCLQYRTGGSITDRVYCLKNVGSATGGASGGMNMRAFEHGIKAEELAGPIRNSTGTSSLSWPSQSGSSHTVECDNSMEF